MESVCGGNSTAGSNPALSASDRRPRDGQGFDRPDRMERSRPSKAGTHRGARALCIASLRIVSGPEGSSTKEDLGECRRSPGFHGGFPTPPVSVSVSVSVPVPVPEKKHGLGLPCAAP